MKNKSKTMEAIQTMSKTVASLSKASEKLGLSFC